MSKEIENIEKFVMNKIHQKKIKMKPKLYFILGSVLTFLGLISTIIISSFVVSLISFSLKTNYGCKAQYKLTQAINNFPWWLIIIAVVGLILGLWLIKKYDFTYKIKPWIIILGFISATIFAGLMINKFNLDKALIKNQPIRKMMKIHLNENNPNIPKYNRRQILD